MLAAFFPLNLLRALSSTRTQLTRMTNFNQEMCNLVAHLLHMLTGTAFLALDKLTLISISHIKSQESQSQQIAVPLHGIVYLGYWGGLGMQN